MTESVKDRAMRLIEREDRTNEERAEREREQAEESRIQQAISRVRQQDREVAAEQARREAAAEADDLARERRALEERLEQEAMALNRSLAELGALDRRHRAALARAGKNPGHSGSLRTVLPRWFAHRFGGFNALTGVAGSHPNGKERTLPERDPLSRTDPDRGLDDAR